MGIHGSAAICLSVCLTAVAADSPSETGAALAPFVLPWDDGAKGPTDLSFLNHVPAGKFGVIRAGEDGHFYAGDERIRFMGVNLCFASTVPTHEDAPKIAARMAKFGINAVRFHHTDTSPFPAGLTRRDAKASGELHPEALDRFDFLVSELEKRGIYVNINLLIGRRFNAGDGLPAEIESLDWKDRHTVGMFFAPMIELQKRYAKDLLTHRNPYTKRTYAEDPGVAIVEINNENGIIQHWLAGDFDALPRPFADDLARQWNAWLKNRYQSTSKLRQEWKLRDEPMGDEMLKPAGVDRGWTLERHGEAVASVRPDGEGVARITIEKAGRERWHVQYNQRNLKVKAAALYTLAFRAKADRPRAMEAGFGQAHEPWGNIGLTGKVSLTQEWQDCRFVFAVTADDDNARVNFSGLGSDAGSVWMGSVSLRTGGSQGLRDGESLEQGTAPILLHNDSRGWPKAARTDMVRFLWDTEQHYWQTMRKYVKQDLGFKGIVMGTIVSCSTPNLQAQFDAVDGHAYWKHPSFPVRPWDPENWTVGNLSMASEAGGTVAGLSMQRVAGKPFTVTEYNHPAPNTYSSEAPLLLATQAALQDWDALFLFTYNQSGRWDARKIGGFFDISQHPTKMANMIPAALLLRAAQVAPAREEIVTGLPASDEPGLILAHGRGWKQIEHDQLGLKAAMSLLHRTALRVGPSVQAGPAPTATPPDMKHLVSDTGEVTWDRRREGKGMVTIDAPRMKAVVGFADGQPIALGKVTIAPGTTRQGWCTICLSLLQGESFDKPGHALVVTTGEALNTGMQFKDETRSSVGRNWGEAPSLVEVVPARITLPVAATRAEAWSLDERGQRGERLKVTPDGSGRCTLQLGTQKTLWYEIVIR